MFCSHRLEEFYVLCMVRTLWAISKYRQENIGNISHTKDMSTHRLVAFCPGPISCGCMFQFQALTLRRQKMDTQGIRRRGSSVTVPFWDFSDFFLFFF